MYSEQSVADLLMAYNILFGSGRVGLPAVVLQDLKPDDLKTAFRKRALATHPDRSIALGVSKEELQVRFQQVTKAYELLKPYVSRGYTTGRNAGLNRQPPPPPRRKPEKKARNHRYFSGKLPERPLKIGQYLYYSKAITWQMLIDAIVWQKKQRPLFGQIAREWGYLTAEEIVTIISRKDYRDRFGEFAIRMGYLTPFQQMAIIGRQKISQPLMGHYFIRNGIFSTNEMNDYQRQMAGHNLRIRQPKYR